MAELEEPKNGNGTHDDPMVVEVKNRNPLALSQIITLLVIGITIACLIPTSVTLYLFSLDNDSTERLGQENRDLAVANRKLINEVDKQRVLGDQRAYDQCIAAEARDTVIVEWGGELLRLANRLGTDRDVLSFIQALEDGIVRLEPPDEEECKPPTEVMP